MDRWTPYSTRQRHRRNLNQPTIQPDGQPTMPVVSRTTNIDQNHITAHRQHDSLQNYSYPSINASGNSNLILGNVQQVHYHVSPAAGQVREQLLSSLHFREMFVRFDNIDDPHSDTFEWILRPPEDERRERSSLLHWLHSDGSLFWVSGKPGSGKSVLMKHLAQRIREAVKYDEASVVVLSFWFWEAAHQELERSLLGCLRSLLWQLLQLKAHGNSVSESIEHNLPFEWTKRRLRDNLANALSMLAQSGVQTYMLLDGIDESGPEASEVLAFIRDTSKCCPTIKLCVSSRPEPLLQQAFSGCSNLKMQDLNLADVRTIVKKDLLEAPELAQFTDSQCELELLEDEIVEDANGVLLWVRIVIRDLLLHAASGDTLGEMRAHLRRLPAELEGENGLWAFMLRRNAKYSKHYLADAALYLQIACHAEVSLLSYCLATNSCLRDRLLRFDKGWKHLHNQIDCARLAKAISARTGGLLWVSDYYEKSFADQQRGIQIRDPALTHLLNVENTRIIRFVHRTARSFLLETKTGQDLLSLYRGTAADLDRMIFEGDLIASIQLPSIERVGPLSFNRILLKTSPKTSSDVRLFKIVLESLAEKGLLWMESYNARWLTLPPHLYDDTGLPLPILKLSGQDVISFAHIFASQGWAILASDEIKQLNLPENAELYCLSVSIALLGSLTFVGYEHDADLKTRESLLIALFSSLTFECYEHDTDLKTCESLLSSRVDLKRELVNMLGEPISVVNSVFYSYCRFPRTLEISISRWLEQDNPDIMLLRYEPTMIDCSSQFFKPGSFRTSILGAVCLEEALISKTFLGPQGDLETRLAQYLKADGVRVLCVWQSKPWVAPHMYALRSSDYMDVLKNLLNDIGFILKSSPTGIFQFFAGGKEGWDVLFGRIRTQDRPVSRVHSLLEAFRLLGKSKASIEAFIATEEPRIRAMYEPEVYRGWRSWLYGTEDAATDTQNGASSC